MVAKKTKKAPKKKRKVNFLNNKDLLAEVILSKKQNKMTDKLALMLQTLAARYASKPNFSQYTYIQDMQAFALMQLCHTWSSFKPELSDNPFAYFTQCVKRSYFQMLNKEKRQRLIRDELLISKGAAPSGTYIADFEHQQESDRQECVYGEAKINEVVDEAQGKKLDS